MAQPEGPNTQRIIFGKLEQPKRQCENIPADIRTFMAIQLEDGEEIKRELIVCEGWE
jgi:hypothetical protein